MIYHAAISVRFWGTSRDIKYFHVMVVELVKLADGRMVRIKYH
jgi:hypothetical protein